MDIRVAPRRHRRHEQVARSGVGEVLVLVLTTFDLDDYVVDALPLGSQRLPAQGRQARRPGRCTRRGHRQPATVAQHAASCRRRGRRRRCQTVVSRLERLSEREREVLALLGEGLANAEICERLVVSMPTTKTHVRSVPGILGLRDRVQAAAFARRNGLTDPV